MLLKKVLFLLVLVFSTVAKSQEALNSVHLVSAGLHDLNKFQKNIPTLKQNQKIRQAPCMSNFANYVKKLYPKNISKYIRRSIRTSQVIFNNKSNSFRYKITVAQELNTQFNVQMISETYMFYGVYKNKKCVGKIEKIKVRKENYLKV